MQYCSLAALAARVDGGEGDAQDLQPPKHLYVVVVATKDLGEIVLPHSQNTIVIRRGETYCERRADLERLLMDGSLREVAR